MEVVNIKEIKIMPPSREYDEDGKKVLYEIWIPTDKGGIVMKDVETNAFTKNEWEVLYKYFVEEKGLKEIGKDFDMTTERVRQILEKIKRKLAYIHSQSE